MSQERPSPRKSDRTRTAILAAARRLFAERGYEATTMREVATSASIDPAMVIRYFGSKDGLFAQAADFELGLPDLTKMDRRRVGRALVRHFLMIWQRDGGGLATLLRSASSNQYAAQTMRDLFASQIKPALAPICGVDAPERAGLVGTQMLGLALCRFILKLPPVVTMSDDEVVAWIGPTIQRYLTARTE